MSNEDSLKYFERQLDSRIRLKEALEQAAVMIRTKGNTLANSCLEAAEEFRRESEDIRFQIEEIKIHIEKSKGGST